MNDIRIAFQDRANMMNALMLGTKGGHQMAHAFVKAAIKGPNGAVCQAIVAVARKM